MESYKLLEKEYAHFTGSKFAVSCNSGTSALHLALVSLGIGKGDEVIVPDFTMAACGFAVSYCGAKLRTVDCGPDLQLDIRQLERKINKNTRAIMVVHIYGRLSNMDYILKLARKHKLWVIEDACEAQGAVKNSKAHVTCYSFYKNKIIPAEEGGILTTNLKFIHDRANYFKNMCFGSSHNYHHSHIGYNYRLTEDGANKALRSLKDYEANSRKRRKIEKWYDQLIPDQYKMPKRDAVWVYDTKLPYKPIPGARHFFQPLSSMPMWKQKVGKNAKYYSQFMYLPVHPSMTKKDVERVVKQCNISAVNTVAVSSLKPSVKKRAFSR